MNFESCNDKDIDIVKNIVYPFIIIIKRMMKTILILIFMLL